MGIGDWVSTENILLAYRNVKNNTGSKTAGTDKPEHLPVPDRAHPRAHQH